MKKAKKGTKKAKRAKAVAKVVKAKKSNKIRIVKKAPKKVEGAWGTGNKYVCEENESGKGITYTAIKKFADGKQRTDKVSLSAKQVAQLKKEMKKGEKGNFDKLVIELVTKPCFLDSQARKQGLTKNTAYCPVNRDMREILS